MTPAQQRDLQKVFLLVTGTAANAEQLRWLDAVTAWSSRGQAGLAPVIDGFYGALEQQVGAGAIVRTLLDNGLGVTLDADAAAALAQALPAMGVGSWSALFTLLMSTEAGVGRVLAQRSDAAMGFLDALSASGKSAFFQGAAVSQAVTMHLHRIGSSDASHQGALASLADLAANLSATGMRVGVGCGQLSGAGIFGYANTHGMFYGPQWQGQTDARGVAEVPAGLSVSGLAVVDGTDLFTGRAFLGVLSAPMGATVITPLTTLAQALLANSSGMTVAQATGRVLAALDLPATLDLLSFDPFEMLADPVAGPLALRAQAAALQISSVIAVLSHGLAASGNWGWSPHTASAFPLDALAAALTGSAGRLDLTRLDTLQGVVNAALANAGSGLSVAAAAQLAQVLAAGNAAIAASATPTELSRAAVVTQSELVDAVAQALHAGSLDGVVSAYTGASLRQAIAAAVPGQVTMPSGSGGQTLTGSSASDSLQGGLGNDIIRGLAGGDTLEGQAGDDRIEGGDGDDLLAGSYGNDSLYGEAGNDTLYGETGSDLLDGGAGADTLVAHSLWDRQTLLGGAGNDSLAASGLAVWLDGGDDADILVARGTVGPDTRPTYGVGSQATLLGGAGNDRLEARELGRAVLNGDNGNDTLSITSVSAATLTGGAGSDTIEMTIGQYRLAAEGTRFVGEADGAVILERAGTLVVADFASGAGGDVLDWTSLVRAGLSGYESGNPFGRGYLALRQLGADTLLSFDPDGLAGSAQTPVAIAVLRGVTATSLVAANFSPAVAPDGSPPIGARIEGGAGGDRLAGGFGDDSLYGGPGDDVLSDDFGSNLLDGGPGADSLLAVSRTGRHTLVGGAGDDRLGATGTAVVLDGGDGDDQLTADGGLYDGAEPAYVLAARATLLGGAGADQLTVHDLHKATLDGGAGDDTLLVYGARMATLLGGEGRDQISVVLRTMNTYFVESEAGILPAWLIDGGVGNDTLSVEGSGPAWGGTDLTLVGGLGDDTLILNDTGAAFRSALVQGGEGADRLVVSGLQSATLSGGAGSDTIVVPVQQFRTQLEYAPIPWRRADPLVVTDFATGAGGDVLDCVELLTAAAVGYDGSNPFASGHLRLRQSGSDTQLSFDVDGTAGTASAPVVLAVLREVVVSQMRAANVGVGVELNPGWVFG